MSRKNGKANGKGEQRKHTTAEKCKAIACYLAEGLTYDDAADGAEVSRGTFANWLQDYREGRLVVDDFLTAHRASMIPKLVEVQERATLKAVTLAKNETSALDAMRTAEVAGKVISRLAGEADLVIEVRDGEGARAKLLEGVLRRIEAIKAANASDGESVH